ncbi:MAG: MFS transporter [Candidatus Eremiobacteraeota bacterium]|nr:MFS transporter [Candidatus Eremiobacteraeota bacterium]
MTYEGGRSVAGPFLAHLGASGLIVGLVAGGGELIGYALRLASGTVADRSGRAWGFALIGYGLNVLSVPALAFAKSWPVAAALLVGERSGRGVRKPVVGAMLAHAGTQLGHGWVFGFHEAMDQTGATIGPLIVALMLALGSGFNRAFAVLAIPAILSLAVLLFARRAYPTPHDLEAGSDATLRGFDRNFWTYAAAGACIAAGFADFALVSFHFSKAQLFSNHVVPILYAGTMLIGALAAPFFGKWYDRAGVGVPIAAFALSAGFAPLCFRGSAAAAVAGLALWGVGMAAQESLLPSMIARITPANRRATALGAFDAVYGVAWFAGSAAMGALYDVSIAGLVIFSVVLQLAALPLLFIASRRGVAV